MNLAAAAQLAQIVKIAYSSVLATAVVSVAFALAVTGFGRGSELGRAGRTAAASAYRTVAICCLLICGAAVVYGVILVGQKN
jgi:hypothetical protein